MSQIDPYIDPDGAMVHEDPRIIPYFTDLSPSTTAQAFHGTSHHPETRGARLRADYARTLLNTRDEVMRTVRAAIERRVTVPDDWEAQIQNWFDTDLRPGLRSVYSAYVAARGNCISAFIVGPAKFPTRRAERANRTVDNRYEDIKRFIHSAKKRITRQLLPHGDGTSIRSDDPEAVRHLGSKAEALERERETIKAVNRILSKHIPGRNGRDATPEQFAAAREALETAGYNPAHIASVLKPDFMGRVGFPSYVLQNLGARIRTAKARQTEVAAVQDANIADTIGDVEVSTSDDQKIMIAFPGIPSPETRSLLKSCAFKWSRQRGAWVRKLTANAAGDYRRRVRPELVNTYGGENA